MGSQQATGLKLPPAVKMRPLPTLFLLSYISLARAGTLAGDGARFWPGFPGWPWGGAGGGTGAGDGAVTYLDNSQSSAATTFTFSQSIGITLGHEESNGGSIDTTIKNGIELSLFETFKWTLDISVTTGFNWSQKDSTTWSDQKTYTVSQSVPAGEKVQIHAAVGYCGQNMVETKMFRVISTRTRKVLEYKNAV